MKTEYSDNLLCNMQYYMEYCYNNGYVTPQEWLISYKHYTDKKEPTYTEEEVKSLCAKAMYQGECNEGCSALEIEFDEWFNQNKK